MKKMTVGKFKTRFAEVLEHVQSGIGIAVTYEGKKKLSVIFFPWRENPQRKVSLV